MCAGLIIQGTGRLSLSMCLRELGCDILDPYHSSYCSASCAWYDSWPLLYFSRVILRCRLSALLGGASRFESRVCSPSDGVYPLSLTVCTLCRLKCWLRIHIIALEALLPSPSRVSRIMENGSIVQEGFSHITGNFYRASPVIVGVSMSVYP